MKKLIAMLLCLTMVLSLAACTSKEEQVPEEEPAVEENPAGENEPAVEEQPEEEAPAEEETPAEDEPATMPEEGEGMDVMPEVTPEEEAPAIEYMPEEKLNEMMGLLDQLVGGINDELAVMSVEVTSDMFEYYVNTPYFEGAYAVVSAPIIGSIAHEVVLVELPEGTDVEAVAAEMEANMNPRKWVCVEAEESWVKTSGNYVLQVMSTSEMANAIEANFNTVFGE